MTITRPLSYPHGMVPLLYEPLLSLGNMNAPTIIVAPLTSQLKVPMPTHVEFMNPEGEINTILLEHLRSISRSRFRRYKWTLDNTTMNMVDAAIAVSVGLIPLPPAPAFQLNK